MLGIASYRWRASETGHQRRQIHRVEIQTQAGYTALTVMEDISRTACQGTGSHRILCRPDGEVSSAFRLHCVGPFAAADHPF